jgi:4-amino-4-deoxy-L-arabinose transferase-like glycosyltransferase
MRFLVRHWRKALWFIFAAALLARGSFIWSLQEGFYFPDSLDYSRAATNLLENGGLGEGYHRPPGYPFFLSIIYLFFGESILAVRILESLVGALLAVIIAQTAKQIGGRPVGMLAGVLWGVFPIAVFIAGLIYPTNIFTMFLACGVLCFLSSSDRELSPKRVFFSGVIWGIAALIIPIVLVTIGAISLWLIWWNRSNRLVLTSLLLVGAALVIVPWMVRDFYVYDRLTLIEPRLVQHLPEMPNDKEAGGAKRIEAIAKQPGSFGKHFSREFIHFWKLYPDRIEMATPGKREEEHRRDARIIKETVFTTNSLIIGVSVLSTGPLFIFAIVGTLAMWLHKEERRDLSLLWAIILSFAVGYSIFHTRMRYRIPIEPYLVILSAYGLWQTVRMVATQMRHSPDV